MEKLIFFIPRPISWIRWNNKEKWIGWISSFITRSGETTFLTFVSQVVSDNSDEFNRYYRYRQSATKWRLIAVGSSQGARDFSRIRENNTRARDPASLSTSRVSARHELQGRKSVLLRTFFFFLWGAAVWRVELFSGENFGEWQLAPLRSRSWYLLFTWI